MSLIEKSFLRMHASVDSLMIVNNFHQMEMFFRKKTDFTGGIIKYVSFNLNRNETVKYSRFLNK